VLLFAHAIGRLRRVHLAAQVAAQPLLLVHRGGEGRQAHDAHQALRGPGVDTALAVRAAVASVERAVRGLHARRGRVVFGAVAAEAWPRAAVRVGSCVAASGTFTGAVAAGGAGTSPAGGGNTASRRSLCAPNTRRLKRAIVVWRSRISSVSRQWLATSAAIVSPPRCTSRSGCAATCAARCTRRRRPMAWARIRLRLKRLLRRHINNPVPAARKIAKDLREYGVALWTFARVEGVEPTNNAAERAVRKADLWRKTSFGSASRSGSRFAERMLTVCESLRSQGRSILDFLVKTLSARLAGGQGPSLLVDSA
jgi:Transposase IS66 family